MSIGQNPAQNAVSGAVRKRPIRAVLLLALIIAGAWIPSAGAHAEDSILAWIVQSIVSDDGAAVGGAVDGLGGAVGGLLGGSGNR